MTDTDITIPPEAEEAGVRADYEHWREKYAVRGETPEWEDADPDLRAEFRASAAVIIRAAVNAWPGVCIRHRLRPHPDTGEWRVPEPMLCLPLPQEPR